MAAVLLAKLTRRYQANAGAPAALRSLDLEVASGELLVIVGPSGCGKSTTLRLIAGLDEPDEGTITIEGRSMLGVPPQDRDVAMVFQGYALYPHMRVREILAFPLKMRGIAPAERNERVLRTAALLKLTNLLDRRPGELSGGERQRVAMGRAIVRRPKVFLFDEPLSNLDPVLRAELRVELGGLLRELGATAIYVTHDQVEAMTLGDRIAIMKQGALQQVGTPREVYTRPSTDFVAGFLGSPPMNLLSCAHHAEGRAAVPLQARRLGFRPEHVRVVVTTDETAPGASMADRLKVAATVLASEPLGAETHLVLESKGEKLFARTRGFEAPSRGSDIALEVDWADLHWFDERGNRL